MIYMSEDKKININFEILIYAFCGLFLASILLNMYTLSKIENTRTMLETIDEDLQELNTKVLDTRDLIRDIHILAFGQQNITQPEQKTEERIKAIGTGIGGISIANLPICSNKGLPVVRFFGASWCPHCSFEKPIIENVTAKFDGLIDFESFLLDKDNVSSEENYVFSMYSDGSIPLTIIGCKYFRLGSGESVGAELDSKYLTAYICNITNNQPSNVCSEVSDVNINSSGVGG